MLGAAGLAVGTAAAFAAGLAVASPPAAAPPVRGSTRCPGFIGLRAPRAVEQSNTSRDAPGFYYWLALHDVAQGRCRRSRSQIG